MTTRQCKIQIQFNNKTFHDKPSMQKKTQFNSLIYKSWPAFINLPLAGTVVANV
ncbi:hypothetical protein SLEP1_g60083 [Rubroshorea leprosula]|uniref:Uncharacterized protein n=1 Tax=Rubroshorea leprosula TaxID=152421 RepID=A0AAV5MX69_9ROSI|nr:hypothetical protein SLEP1_g60083 [Rubroshorea leprosula]